MRFKSVIAFISLAVALGVLAYLFLSVKKEVPAISHADKNLSRTDAKSHDINLEENSPNEVSHNENEISHSEKAPPPITKKIAITLFLKTLMHKKLSITLL
ncbi:hypothetical protein ID0563_13140 [Helicobacter pylori]